MALQVENGVEVLEWGSLLAICSSIRSSRGVQVSRGGVEEEGEEVMKAEYKGRKVVHTPMHRRLRATVVFLALVSSQFFSLSCLCLLFSLLLSLQPLLSFTTTQTSALNRLSVSRSRCKQTTPTPL